MLLLIAIIFLVLVFLCGGFALGIWWWYEKAKDNYELAWIFVERGGHTNVFKGRLATENSQSVMYTYSKNKSIVIPHVYGFCYYKHRRRIELSADGKLAYKNEDVPTQPEYDKIIKSLTLNHIGADIINAMSGKQLGLMFIIIVVVVALAIGAFGMNFYNNSKHQNSVQTTQQTTPIPTPKLQSGEVK